MAAKRDEERAMKIHPDQIKPIESERQGEQKPRPVEGGGFGDILAREVEGGQVAQQVRPPLKPPPATAAILQVPKAERGGDRSAGQEVMQNIENLLGEWEDYASQLAATDDGPALRQANRTLESLESGVERLKSKLPELGGDNPGLKSLVDEIEILAVTERIKLNRGDYLS